MALNENNYDTAMFSQSQKTSSIMVNETYSYINNTMFYALAPAPYYNYFYQFVRRWANWYDRYVPTFHNAENGIFSTGIAHALVDGIANVIVGAEVKLKNTHKEIDPMVANGSLKRAYEWADKAQFTNKLRQAVKYAGALGTSLLKANVSDGEIWLEPMRMDDFWFTTDFKGNLQEVCCLVKSYTDTGANAMESQRKKKAIDKKYDASVDLSYKYYLVEHRRFEKEDLLVDKVQDDGQVIKVIQTMQVPYVSYEVHRYNGSITNAQMWTSNAQAILNSDNIPRCITDLIVKDYGVVDFNKPHKLPFAESLGCALLRYNSGDGSLSQQPFGESILNNIVSYLMGYDLEYSYFIRDMYQGKGIVFIAKELVSNTRNPNVLSGLDESMFTQIPMMNDRDNKLPIESVQFNLRVEEWRIARNTIYESIATHLNISPSSIASFLSDNTARTAREVSTEANATDNYVDIQRGAITPYIDELLKVIGAFYGWQDTVGIRWAKTGTNNMDTLIDRIIKLKSAGLITQYEALKMYNIDADEAEIQELDKRLTEYNKEQSRMRQREDAIRFGGMDYSFNTELEALNEKRNK